MIYKKPLFVEILFLSVFIAVVHYVASIFSLYYTISWFDIPMHFLGGFLIGLIAFFVFFTSDKINFPKDNNLVIFTVVIFSVLIVGLAWELWELFFGLSDAVLDRTDTIADLIMDIIGAVFAYFYGLRNGLKKSAEKFYDRKN